MYSQASVSHSVQRGECACLVPGVFGGWGVHAWSQVLSCGSGYAWSQFPSGGGNAWSNVPSRGGYTRGNSEYTEGSPGGGYTRGVGIPEGVGIPRGIYIPLPQTWDLGMVGKRMARILLECFLVLYCVYYFSKCFTLFFTSHWKPVQKGNNIFTDSQQIVLPLTSDKFSKSTGLITKRLVE